MAYIHQSDEHHRLMHTDADTNVFSDAVDHTHMAMAFPLTARSLNLTLGFLLDRSLNSTARELYVRNPMGAFLNLASGYLREDTTTPLIDPPELPRLIASYQSFLAVTGLNLEETCRADSFLDSVMKVSEPEVTQSFWMAGICAMSLVAASSLLLRQFFSSTSAGATSCTLGVAAFIALAPQASALALFTAVLASAVVSAIPIPNLMAETAMQGRSASAQGHHSTEASA